MNDTPYIAEALSTAAMGITATWTVSTGAFRALSMRRLLRESGESQPAINESSALMLPVISSATLLIMYFLFTYIQNFLVLYMVVASFGATSMCLFEPVALAWPRLCVLHARCLACVRGCYRCCRSSVPLGAGHRPSPMSRCPPLGLGALVVGSVVGAGGSGAGGAGAGHGSLSHRGTTTLSSLLAASLVACWLLTGHWLALNALGVCITVSVVSLIRLPSLKVAAIALVSLFFYDIFWVFFSANFFADNVMVAVATKKADNPAQQIAEKLNMDSAESIAKSLQLPIKLMFPAGAHHGLLTFHMLGLGDMAIPGLFLAFALAFDAHLEAAAAAKAASLEETHGGGARRGGSSSSAPGEEGQQQHSPCAEPRQGGGNESLSSPCSPPPASSVLSDDPESDDGVRSSASADAANPSSSLPPSLPPPTSSSSSSELLLDMEPPPPDTDQGEAIGLVAAPKERPYFQGARRGYVFGLVLSIVASRVFGAAQPALLYLVPCVLAPLVGRAKARGHLALLWAGFEEEEEDDGEDDEKEGNQKKSKEEEEADEEKRV